MKKVILITFILLTSLPMTLSAQTRSFRDLYDRYAGRDGYFTVEMSGPMLGFVNGLVNDTAENSAFMDNVDNLVIIVADSEDDPGFGRHVDEMVCDGGYTLMATVRDGRDKVQFYMIEESEGLVSEFIMTVVSDSDYVVMSMTGSGLDIDEISQIARRTSSAIMLED